MPVPFYCPELQLNSIKKDTQVKLENLLHRFFDTARLNIQISDRFGNPINPREWFLVPLFVIDEVVEKIKDGTLSQYQYDASSVKLIEF